MLPCSGVQETRNSRINLNGTVDTNGDMAKSNYGPDIADGAQ